MSSLQQVDEEAGENMPETEKKQILDDDQISTLEKLLQNMKFGSITLIVQDGKVIQIDKTEKYRM